MKAERRRRRWPTVTIGLAAVASLALVAMVVAGVSAMRSTAAGTNLALTRDASCGVGGEPAHPAYDPVTHVVYIPNFATSNVSIIGSVCTEVGTVSLPSGARPEAAAFDPQNNFVYVTDIVLNQVYQISGSSVVATITSSSFNGPDGITFDPGRGVLFVANNNINTITQISGTTVGGSIVVGTGPSGITYDPVFNSLLVTNARSSNVTIIESATHPFSAEKKSVGVGTNPVWIAYDPASKLDYVSNFGSGTVSVFNGGGFAKTTVKVGSMPIGVEFSQATLSIFVACQGPDQIFIISGTTVVATDSLPSGTGVFGIAYDDANDKVYVTGEFTNTVTVL